MKTYSLLLIYLALTGCVDVVNTESVSVTAEVFGTSATTENRKILTLIHNEQGENNRLLTLDSAAPIYNVIDVKLKVDSSTGLNPFAEEFTFLSLSSTTQAPSTIGSNWSQSRIGDVAVLRVRKDDINLDNVQFSAFPSSSHFRQPGVSYLARIEDDDRIMPWKIEPGAANCNPIDRVSTWYPSLVGESDCFDLETLAGTLLANLSVQVSEGLWDSSTLPISLNASGHRLYIVPHVELIQEHARNIPGFGFIYQCDISGFAFHATVQIPLSFQYANGEMIIDPLSEGDFAFQNLERIRIIAHTIPTGFALETLQATVTDVLSTATLPSIKVGVFDGEPIMLPLDNALKMLIELSIGQAPATTEQASLIALPVQRTTINTTIDNQVMFLANVTETKRAPTGIIQVTEVDGKILIEKTIPNDQYNRERVITVSGIAVLQAYNLHFLE